MDNFNVQIYDQPAKAKKFFSGPKIVFLILGIIVLAELIYAVRVLSLPNSIPSPTPTLPKTSVKSVARISLNAPKTNYQVTEVVPVVVRVDTGGSDISGVDLIVAFDPKILEATPAGLIRGRIFDEYPLVSVNVSKGLISISGISSLGNSFSGTGQFAMINLRAKRSGKTSLVVDFKKGSTTASNLVETNTSKNILDAADNLELEIQ